MEIKRSSSSPSIDQTSSTDKASSSSQPKTSTGISSAKDSWQNFVSDMAANGGAVDPNALVQNVLRESYIQTTEDLRFYADKVKYFNDCKKEVRDYVQNLRDFDTKLKEEFASVQPGQKSNVLETVSQVIKDSLKETNEVKKYYLERLDSMNKINHSLSEMMQKISDASSDMSAKKKDDDD